MLLVFMGLALSILPAPNFADVDYIGLSDRDIRAFNPHLADWAWHESKQAAFDWIPLGAFIAGLAYFGVRKRERWAWLLLTIGMLAYFAGYLTIHATVSFTYPIPFFGILLLLGVTGVVLSKP
jgi:hypothetical protein